MIVGRKPKLTPEQVRQVLEWAAFGTTRVEVAKKLGICSSTLTAYIRGEHKRPVRQ